MLTNNDVHSLDYEPVKFEVKKTKPDLKKKQRRKSADKKWTPKSDRASIGRKSGNFDLKSLFNIMGAGASPAKKQAIVSGSLDPLCLSPQKDLIFSSPQRGLLTTSVFTPKNGTRLDRVRTAYEGNQNRGTSVFLPPEKVLNKKLILPQQPNSAIDNVKVPNVSGAGFKNVPITLQSITDVEKLVSDRRNNGESARLISQNRLMGNESANNLLILAGIQSESGIITKEDKIGQWLHLKPHSTCGDDSQNPENVGLGTKYANAAMELVNHVIKKIFQLNPDIKTLYLDVIPTWVPGYEKIRLLQDIKYQVKDGPDDNFSRGVTYHFDALSLDPICESEIDIHQEVILRNFASRSIENPVLVTASPTKLNKLQI